MKSAVKYRQFLYENDSALLVSGTGVDLEET